MTWSRASRAVFEVFPSRTRGRMPAKTLKTSSRAGSFTEILPGGGENEVNFVLHGDRFEGGGGDRRVGGSDQRVTVPWDREEHAAVARVRHQDGAPAGQEAGGKHEMNALARCDHWFGSGFGLGRGLGLYFLPQGVAERTGGVDHHLTGGAEFFSRLYIPRRDALDMTLGIFGQSRDFHVVQQCRPLLESGRHHVDEQAGVVKLTVVVHRAAAQAFRFKGGEMRQRFFFREDAGRAKAVFARQQLIQFQADAVKSGLPPVVVRDHKGQFVHDVGSVLQQESALFQRLHHQADVALLQDAVNIKSILR